MTHEAQPLRPHYLLQAFEMLRDPLTQLPLRDTFEQQFAHHEPAARRYLFFADVMGMKRFNGEHSYSAGDRHLQQGVAAIKRYLGDSVCLCRYGGDELVAWMSEEQRAHAISQGIDAQTDFRYVFCTTKPSDEHDLTRWIDRAYRELLAAGYP